MAENVVAAHADEGDAGIHRYQEIRARRVCRSVMSDLYYVAAQVDVARQ